MNGLKSSEVIELQQKYGKNELPEVKPNPIKLFVRKIISPVPVLMIIATVIVCKQFNTVSKIVKSSVNRVEY